MKMKLNAIYDNGRVRRFHTVPDYTSVASQNIAEHSWGVALICIDLCRRLDHEPSAKLLTAALLHDIEEGITGDTPAPAKWKFPELRAALVSAEVWALRELGLSEIELNDAEQLILKWADSIELVLYCNRKIKTGNQAYGIVHANILQYIYDDLEPLSAGYAVLQEIL